MQEHVKKAFCLNFKSFSRIVKQFFLTVGQNNFGNKIPLVVLHCIEEIPLKFFDKMVKKGTYLKLLAFYLSIQKILIQI